RGRAGATGGGPGAGRGVRLNYRPGTSHQGETHMASTIVSVVGGRAVKGDGEAGGAPAGTLTSVNPSRLTDQVAEVTLASAGTFAAACAAAKRAQPAWADVPAPVRGRAITAMGRIVQANKEALAPLVTPELPKPYAAPLR